jgi:hypothetical protein
LIRDAAYVAPTTVIECPLPAGGIEGIIMPQGVSVKFWFDIYATKNVIEISKQLIEQSIDL